MDKRIDSRRRRPWGVSAAGAIAALVLHLALLSALTLGSSAGKVPRRQGDPSIATPNTDDGTMSALIFLDPTVLSRDMGFASPSVSVRSPALKRLRVAQLVRLDAIERALSGDDEDSKSPNATAVTQVDGAERAMLFGRYVNQIVARIDRLWVLPQSAPMGASFWSKPPVATSDSRNLADSGPFRCRVQILQSRDGAVLEVTLLDCDGSPEWQQSLVNAIDAASPLPSPPSESVFARSLVLSFTSAGRMR
ncbi:MAG: TonB C-terminal domain-containing protein [Steroidobacteraceae bacterium]